MYCSGCHAAAVREQNGSRQAGRAKLMLCLQPYAEVEGST